MHRTDGNGVPEPIAREGELATLRAFVLGETTGRALVISGEPGVGKTVLWDVAVATAAAAGVIVLSARAAEAEATLPFATLSDLFEGLELGPGLPPPQRRALEVALLRVEPTAVASEPRAIALGVLTQLRSMATGSGIVLAIDDAQWIDPSSIAALGFAIRRLAEDNVQLLITRRTGKRTALESAVDRQGVLDVVVDGLSLGAIRRLLITRLGLTLSRRVVRQVTDASLGNPLFALEIGRAMVQTGPPSIGQDIPLPDSLDDLLGARANASESARLALLVVALGGNLTGAELADMTSDESVATAIDDHLIEDEHGRVRPAHPLLAASVIRHATDSERRAVHTTLARATTDPVRRARHLAAAAVDADADLANVVAVGAAEAGARGATEEAIELAEAALRLTPVADPRRDSRVLDLAGYLFLADEGLRLNTLLGAELATLGPGAARARAHLLLARLVDGQENFERHRDAALRESPAGSPLRAQALAAGSIDRTIAMVEQIESAERGAREALELAQPGPSLVAAVFAMAWVRTFRGQPVHQLRGRVDDPSREANLEFALERVEGVQLAFRGQLEEARAVFRDLIDEAEERGQEVARTILQLQRCEVELRAGDRFAAQGVMDEIGAGDASVHGSMESVSARLRAVAAALLGDAEAVELWAKRYAETNPGERWGGLEIDRARGIAALAGNEPARAVKALNRVWHHTEAEMIEDPGAFPVAADLVEAAIGVGDMALADAVTSRLAELAERLDHPWGRASAKRCRGLIGLVAGADFEANRILLLAAADDYERLGCRFDAARTLLALGRQARRNRQWAVAREVLELASNSFIDLGCDRWAAYARELFTGLGGRKPRNRATLTPTEGQVVSLASDGRSNKEIAAALYVTVHTVEVHLSHAYAKLGVRSRGQLARALGADRTRGAPGNN